MIDKTSPYKSFRRHVGGRSHYLPSTGYSPGVFVLHCLCETEVDKDRRQLVFHDYIIKFEVPVYYLLVMRISQRVGQP